METCYWNEVWIWISLLSEVVMVAWGNYWKVHYKDWLHCIRGNVDAQQRFWVGSWDLVENNVRVSFPVQWYWSVHLLWWRNTEMLLILSYRGKKPFLWGLLYNEKRKILSLLWAVHKKRWLDWESKGWENWLPLVCWWIDSASDSDRKGKMILLKDDQLSFFTAVLVIWLAGFLVLSKLSQIGSSTSVCLVWKCVVDFKALVGRTFTPSCSLAIFLCGGWDMVLDIMVWRFVSSFSGGLFLDLLPVASNIWKKVIDRERGME